MPVDTWLKYLICKHFCIEGFDKYIKNGCSQATNLLSYSYCIYCTAGCHDASKIFALWSKRSLKFRVFKMLIMIVISENAMKIFPTIQAPLSDELWVKLPAPYWRSSLLFLLKSDPCRSLPIGAHLIWNSWSTAQKPDAEEHKNYIGKWSVKWPMNKIEIELPFEINLFEFYYL